jgi:hypothetical protein
MATVEFDPELLRQLILPGIGAQIVSARWLSDQFRDVLALELRGPDVPDCKKAQLIMKLTFDDTRPAPVLTATLKPAD